MLRGSGASIAEEEGLMTSEVSAGVCPNFALLLDIKRLERLIARGALLQEDALGALRRQ